MHNVKAPINSRIEVIIAQNKGETIKQVYDRLNPKPEILINGNMYNTEERKFVQGIKIGENVLCKANYGGHLLISDKGKYSIERQPSINFSCDFAIEGTGIIKPRDVTGINKAFVTGKHERQSIGLSKDYINIVATTKEIDFDELEKAHKDSDTALNLDGGGSVGLIANGKVLINSYRPNMNYLAIYYPKGYSKKPYIALDDGHGMKTPGKRTPAFPDGSVMHENEFNRAVLGYLKENLLACQFDVLETAPTDEDTPLTKRTDLANKENVDLYLSIHANAYGKGEWNGVRGIETFVHKSYPDTINIAQTIHKWIMKGTSMPDRGVKDGSHLHVCRETKMSAVLVELGFMTNREDAALLLSDEYRIECANELTQALCEVYNKKYVPVNRTLPQIKKETTVKYKGKSLNSYITNEGRTVTEVRQLAEMLGYKVEWDSKTQTVEIKLPSQ